MWHLLKREGVVVARCIVERLMREQGLRGVRRGRQFVTTRPNAAAVRPPDLVERDFSARRPNQLWVVDFTYVPTREGTAFTPCVTDAFARTTVGWRTTNRMPTESNASTAPSKKAGPTDNPSPPTRPAPTPSPLAHPLQLRSTPHRLRRPTPRQPSVTNLMTEYT